LVSAQKDAHPHLRDAKKKVKTRPFNKLKKKLGAEGGGGFNPRTKPTEPMRALQAAEKLNSEGDGGFNPPVKPIESIRALAPEGCLP
jgi:hypothetical protein